MLERGANREVENWSQDQVATFTFLWLSTLKENQKVQKRGMKEVSQILSNLNEMKLIQG